MRCNKMQIEKKIEYVFSNISNMDMLNNYDCNVLLDISEPLMFVLNELDDYYFAYTLQSRTALLKNNTKADVIEMLIVNTSIEKIKNLIEGSIDIRDALSNDNMYRVGKIGNKIFPKKYVNNIKQVECKVPKIGVRFDSSLPNKVNINKVLNLIEANAKFYSDYILSEEKPKVKRNIQYNTNESINSFEIKENMCFYNFEKKWMLE